jgi:hypothetical protein
MKSRPVIFFVEKRIQWWSRELTGQPKKIEIEEEQLMPETNFGIPDICGAHFCFPGFRLSWLSRARQRMRLEKSVCRVSI